MSGTTFFVAAVLLGVKFGSQPLPDGGMEYIIQLEPLAVESLKSGADIRSDIPLAMRDVRSFRITVTDGATPTTNRPFAAGAVLPASQTNSATSRGAMLPTTPSGSFPLPKPGTSPQEGSLPPAGAATAKVAEGGFQAKMFPPIRDVKPILDQKPAFPERMSTAQAAEKRPSGDAKQPAIAGKAAEPEPLKPSLTLTLSLAASTAGSLAGMVFFGWVAWDYRGRYRALLHRADGGSEEGEPTNVDDSPDAADPVQPAEPEQE